MLFLALTLALVALGTTHASTCVPDQTCCDISSSLVEPVTLFDYTNFSTSDPLLLTWTEVVDGKLRLAKQETNGGVVGYVWNQEGDNDGKTRISDGFVSTFSFTAQNTGGSPGDGFTYFIQNDRVVDLNGGSGDKLGGFGIARSIAVKFDLCPGRPTCTTPTVGVELVDADFNVIAPIVTPQTVLGLADGAEKDVEVFYQGRYFGAQARLIVKVSGTEILNEVVGDLSSKLFGGRFAYFGFTASTSWTETADIFVTKWKTQMMPADYAVKEFSTFPLTADFGSEVVFTLIARDSCQTEIPIPAGSVNVTSTMVQNIEGNTETVTFEGNVTYDNATGSFLISYNLQNFLIATYDLDILIEDPSAGSSQLRPDAFPFKSAVQAVTPAPTGVGLPLWALILLIVLILLLILVLSYIVYRLHRYRKKLQENAEFIEAGKKQAELDRLEDGTQYSANPMVGTIDDLKALLSKNEEELERLRQRGALGEDQNFTIEQLQKQRDNLLEEMNRLKREDQEEELRKQKGGNYTVAGARAKKEFGREQI